MLYGIILLYYIALKTPHTLLDAISKLRPAGFKGHACVK